MFSKLTVRDFFIVMAFILGVLIVGNLYSKLDSWSIFGPSKDKVIETQKEEIDTLKDVVETNTDFIDIKKDVSVKKDEVITETVAKIDEVKKKSEATKGKQAKKVEEIKKDPVLSAQEKSEEISRAIIQSLWEDFCQDQQNCGETT